MIPRGHPTSSSLTRRAPVRRGWGGATDEARREVARVDVAHEVVMSDSKMGGGSVGGRGPGGRKGVRGRSTGFRVLDDSIELCAEVRVLVASIAKHDRKLATQLNDATKSVVVRHRDPRVLDAEPVAP